MALLAVAAQAQDEEPKDSTTWLAVPVLFQLPETGWGAGAAVLHTRYFGPQATTPPSQIQFGFAYTQERQVLIYLPFQLYASEDAWRLKGEVGYYRYSYNYYGQGNVEQSSVGERFHVNYPRLRLDWLKPIRSKWFGGFRYWFEDYQVDPSRFEVGGYFDSGKVSGGRGNRISGLGAILLLDRRDHVMSSRSGHYAEFSYQHFSKLLGGSSGFDRYRLDLRGFKTFKERHTLASRLWLEHGTGSIPFQQLALMGGSRRMRGLYEGRFRDHNTAIWQGEYRCRVYGRWGAVAFGSLGMVAPNLHEFNLKYLRNTYGAGIRFMLKEDTRMNLRLDVGVGEGQAQYYFTFGEAF